jgi:hypothetical protein
LKIEPAIVALAETVAFGNVPLFPICESGRAGFDFLRNYYYAY